LRRENETRVFLRGKTTRIFPAPDPIPTVENLS
jgi:hypothetical protein